MYILSYVKIFYLLFRVYFAKMAYFLKQNQVEGCYATLVQVKADEVPPASSAALITYRVMEPHLILRIRPCHGDCMLY